ncbi:hypothetical protein Bca101_033004 [Brassica carinata]
MGPSFTNNPSEFNLMASPSPPPGMEIQPPALLDEDPSTYSSAMWGLGDRLTSHSDQATFSPVPPPMIATQPPANRILLLMNLALVRNEFALFQFRGRFASVFVSGRRSGIRGCEVDV